MSNCIDEYYYRGLGIAQYHGYYEIWQINGYKDEPLAYVKTKAQIDKYIDNIKELVHKRIDWRNK